MWLLNKILIIILSKIKKQVLFNIPVNSDFLCLKSDLNLKNCNSGFIIFHLGDGNEVQVKLLSIFINN